MRDRKRILDAALLIGAGMIAFLVYMPSLDAGFLNWDDDVYISANRAITSLDLDFLMWAMTSTEVANWHPLTWISWAIDYKLFGPGPFGFHLINVILHSINSSLVFLLAFHLSRAAYGEAGQHWRASLIGGISAFLFALHPLHVESVAWVSERKDLLYSLFYITGLLLYLKYASSSGNRRSFFYVFTLAAFALSIMSKAMAVTFPAVLLLLDYYPLNRLSLSKKGLKVLAEKFPFAGLAFTSAFMAIAAQHKSGAMLNLESIPLTARALVAARGYAFYIFKLLFPVDLAPFYPLPTDIRITNPEFLVSAVLVLLITVLCVVFRKNRLYIAVWAFFLLSLAPVIGLFQAGSQAAADRYMYLPSLGFFIMAGALVLFAAERFSSRKAAVTAFTISIVLVSASLGAVTVTQQAIWKDPVTLWTHEVLKYPSTLKGRHLKAGALQTAGRYDEALTELNEALKLDPVNAKTCNEIGVVHEKAGRVEESIDWFSKSIEIGTELDVPYYNRGYSYSRLGQSQKAIDDLTMAIKLNPYNGRARYNLGLLKSKVSKAE